MQSHFDLLQSELCKICKSLSKAKKLHALVIKSHLSEDPFYATQIIRQYAANGDVNSAHHVFDKTSTRSVYLWNSLIRAYAQAQRFGNAFALFNNMLTTNTRPDNFTYACIVRACSENFDSATLRLAHGRAIVSGLGSDSICCSALVTAYSKLGLVNEASGVFDGIPEPDLVLWNSLITGYGYSGLCDKGMQTFNSMRRARKKPDGYTIVGLLLSVADSSLLKIGRGIHGLSLKSGFDSNSHVVSLLVNMYSRCKCMTSAYKVFGSIFQPDLVIWSALIAGYCQAGDYVKALLFFRELNMKDKKADSILIASVLASIAQSASVGPGREIHGYALRNGLGSDVMVSSALVDMYSKCLGLHGCAFEAFRIFNKMLNKGVVPDESTFSALLCACCHAGLVQDGQQLFRRMKDEFDIEAKPEHYVYMVKLLGGAGELEEAYNLIQSLPEPVDKGILGALLSCCNTFGNSELAETIAHRLFESSPDNSVYRVMLSNIYASDGRWDDVKKLRDNITGGLRKLPGQSWIEGHFCKL
ncbi:putative pentatricopeptide repeat-containing protein At1g64310 isoform X2 [Prosopis cineraria]|uniref:putative pentatricopeptide repeat-containing protein At1g64310 isoform X2 n=1 Tax=Prosopis cineraria TaxID=364024 RepID=UPI0024106E09|nr:putative pentatricopeptide repeat-containing protein At1g64310 isoform X2 [Prosopis cineraria]